MGFISVDPADGVPWAEAESWDRSRLERELAAAHAAAVAWRSTAVIERAALLRRVADVLHARRDSLARLISREMGKLLREALAEVDKCAWGCEHYAEHGAQWLADEVIATDAARSLVRYEPLGTILAIMPWNFPLWQALRCAAPALLAGNTVLLKHASNTMQCALALERVFDDAGCPPGVFHALLIGADLVPAVIDDPHVRAVTLTGSEAAGRSVAQAAAARLKKTVLELGGSDPFIVLADADLDAAAHAAVAARFQNAGQSCIAAKRFIVEEAVSDIFVERLEAAIAALRPGHPLDPQTTLAPLARADLRDQLRRQVNESTARGARLRCGGNVVPGAGFFYAASLLDRVAPGMPAFDEELFGPVAAVTRARDAAHAVQLANASRYGLGASVWTTDVAKAQALVPQLECGMVFINAQVKSDPRLPFGGIKDSGYGRELGPHGLREFVNVKTVWTAR
jgi:succinate-semialdehyde dehydrogenase/glutarate-semialdehyde dehydrogenase